MTTFFLARTLKKKSNYDLKIKLIVNSQIEKKANAWRNATVHDFKFFMQISSA